MQLQVKVVARAKKNFCKQEGPALKVYLTAPALDGKANKALVGFLAGHFGVAKSRIKIIKGLKSRNKTIIINDDLMQ